MKGPNGWEIGCFLDVLEVLKDGTHFSPKSTTGKNLYLTSKNIRFGRIDLTNVSYINDEEHQRIFTASPVKKGDVLLTKDGANTGNAAINDLDFEFSLLSSVAYLRTKQDVLNNKYLLQWLLSPSVQRDIKKKMSGQAITRLTLQKIADFIIKFPTLSEQKAIADLLSIWDEAIEKTEKLIEKKEKCYKASLSKHLSIDGLGQIKLKTVLNEISKRNKELLIDQVLSVTNFNGFVSPEEYFGRKVASEDLSNYKIVSKGEYAYNPSRINVGSIARLDNWDFGVLSPMYTIFEIKDQAKLNSNLFLHWLNSHEAKQRIKLSAQGSVRETVSFGDFCSICFPKINIKKQELLANYFDLLSNEIDLLKQLAEKYKTQKRGLMQKLLTGEWRVKTEVIERYKGV